MIRAADESSKSLLLDFLRDKEDYAAALLFTRMSVNGIHSNHALFWGIFDGQSILCGVLMLFGGTLFVSGEIPDTREFHEFVSFLGVPSLFGKRGTLERAGFTSHGRILTAMTVDLPIPVKDYFPFEEHPRLFDVYDLVSNSFETLYISREFFVSDTFEKQRAGFVRLLAIPNDAVSVVPFRISPQANPSLSIINCQFSIISSGGVYWQNRRAAVIESVCTLPEYRGKGLASAIVARLVGELLAARKRPLLLCEDRLTGFYEWLGFYKYEEYGEGEIG